MKAVVLLYTKKDAGDSEEFVFPNLTRIDVTVEGTLTTFTATAMRNETCTGKPSGFSAKPNSKNI